MAQDKKGQGEESDRVTDAEHAIPPVEVKITSSHAANTEGDAERTDNRDQKGEQTPYGFLSRLTLNEWLTFFVGAASLVVSYFTYRNAADTSDLKAAVGNLTSLAGEAHNQAVAMQAQAKSIQGQLEEAIIAQRPWISIAPVITNFSITQAATFWTLSIAMQVRVQNNGHEPAEDIQVKANMIPYNGNPKTARTKLSQDEMCRAAHDITIRFGVVGPAAIPNADNDPIALSTGTQGIGIFPNSSLFLVYGCIDYTYPPDRHGLVLFQYVLGRKIGGYPTGIRIRDGSVSNQFPNLYTFAPSDLSIIKDPTGTNEIR